MIIRDNYIEIIVNLFEKKIFILTFSKQHSFTLCIENVSNLLIWIYMISFIRNLMIKLYWLIIKVSLLKLSLKGIYQIQFISKIKYFTKCSHSERVYGIVSKYENTCLRNTSLSTW